MMLTPRISGAFSCPKTIVNETFIPYTVPMSIRINSRIFLVAVTAFVAVFIVLLPAIDRRVCRRLGLNLQHGLSENANADALLRLRQLVLYVVFLVYVAAFLIIVFFSRSTADGYQVHVAPFQDLYNAVETERGLVDVIVTIFREGIAEGLSRVDIIRPQDIAQVYLNVMLFVPMGYLLPYVFNWFRARATIRPVVACFVISLVTENMQLIFRRGLYDLDDLLSNTLGGFIGQLLFLLIAYVVTHPDWRRELRAYHRWKRHARHMTLYPFARRIGLSRTTLLATYEEAVWDFYVDKLGFRVKKQVMDLKDMETRFLLVMGSSQVEVICFNKKKMIPVQYLTISARNLTKIKKRLEKNGIQVGDFHRDPYTDLRCLSFTGPDRVCITVIEQQ